MAENNIVLVVHFSIARTLEDLPAPEPCPFCGGETQKAFVPYWIEGKTFTVRNDTAPGYECTTCGAGLYDPITDLALLSGAAELLDPGS